MLELQFWKVGSPQISNYDLSSLGRSNCSVIWSPTEKETVGDPSPPTTWGVGYKVTYLASNPVGFAQLHVDWYFVHNIKSYTGGGASTLEIRREPVTTTVAKPLTVVKGVVWPPPTWPLEVVESLFWLKIWFGHSQSNLGGGWTTFLSYPTLQAAFFLYLMCYPNLNHSF